MNKIKNVFHRSQKIKTIEERRPQQFVKRHSTQPATTTATISTKHETSPAIDFSALSEMEKQAYLSWWKDLDPFDLSRIDNQTVLKFLNGCHLEDAKLEQILALFETAGDGLSKVQFFAMLRLIAHAQNGRNISPALVYLGAPIPHFHTNAIDAIIKTSSSTPTSNNHNHNNNNNNNDNNNNNNNNHTPQHNNTNTNNNNDITATSPMSPNINNNNNSNNDNINNLKGDRKSWWGGYERQQQAPLTPFDHQSRRSFVGAPTSFMPQTPLLFHQPQQQQGDTMDYFYPNPNASVFSPVLPDNNNNKLNEMIPPETPTPTTDWNTDVDKTLSNPRFSKPNTEYTHGRSRSAGTASDFMQDFEQDDNNNIFLHNPLQSSKSSLSLHDLADTGQSLLLTQKFVYQSPSLRNKESLNNPFNTIVIEDEEESPFVDMTTTNSKPNSRQVIPPPVPSQLTKPPFPKYTRTNNYLLKRSQSTAIKKENHIVKHQRHKSTGNTNVIIY